jgi:uncharacterized protein (DUF4213/DUF364 family)
MNPWQLYDDLIEGISDDLSVVSCYAGYSWTSITSDEDQIGIAFTVPTFSRPYTAQKPIVGSKLKEIALLSKSWNFVEAAVGVAAINAYYNRRARASTCGAKHPGITDVQRDSFDIYQKEVAGLKVTVVGHFPRLEGRLSDICDLTILERKPQWGDLPDPACEYILGEQDYVFITASTLVNKTMPRLLALTQNSKTIIVGPTTTMSPVLFDHGANGLSGLIVDNAQRCEDVLREGNSMVLFDLGEMVSFIRQ